MNKPTWTCLFFVNLVKEKEYKKMVSPVVLGIAAYVIAPYFVPIVWFSMSAMYSAYSTIKFAYRTSVNAYNALSNFHNT